MAKCFDCEHCQPFAQHHKYAGSYLCKDSGEGMTPEEAHKEHDCMGFSTRKQPDPEMLETVTCLHCRQVEYWGMMHWHNGSQYCRRCIYEIWKEQSNYKWQPGPLDYTFPIFSDGRDYIHKGGESNDETVIST